jgi:hypothetical protein
MRQVSFETTIKGGLPCVVEADIRVYREHGELFSETERLEVFWPRGNKPMPYSIWKADASDIQTQAEEAALNA